MKQFFESLDRTPSSALLVLSLVVFLLAVLTIWQIVVLAQMRARWARLIQGASPENLESLLERHLEERDSLNSQLTDVTERVDTLDRKMKTAKRYVGLVKYDAFEDVGGSQSFSLAFYDEEGNGSIVTSLVGREGCRVYGKSLANGKSDRNLSKEEEMAIEQATSSRSRPRISS